MHSIQVSVVIPCFNSGVSVVRLFEELKATFSDNTTWELILVCDACPNDTWSHISRISRANPKIIKSYLLGKNIGQHRATLFGISRASGKYLVTMDDDGQHLPKTIPDLINALGADYDLIYGLPIKDEHGFVRNILSRCLKSFLSFSGIMKHAKKISALRIFRFEILPSKEQLQNYDGLVDSLLIARTDKVGSLRVEMKKRDIGKSNYSLGKLINHALELLFRSTEIPLLAVTKIGFFGSLISINLAFLTLINKIVDRIVVPGYASTVIFFGFSLSLVLLLLGMIGRAIFGLQTNRSGQIEIWIRDSSLD